MSETAEEALNKDESKPPEEKQEKASSPMEEKLIKQANLALELPIPDQNSFWALTGTASIQKKRRLSLPFFKKQEITEEELSQLKDTAERAPGRAKVKIQELLSNNQNNADLMMLFSICSYRMVLNSSNRKGVLEGVKNATKDAANALLADGISLYNCEKFADIYFEYLSRLKRFQVSTYQALGETLRQQQLRKRVEKAIKVVINLQEEKNRVLKVLNQVKGRFKSSSYSAPWEFSQIKTAGKKVEQSDYKFICGPAEARQMVVYTMALLEAFARIPILSPLVDTLLSFIPEGTPDLYLRKASVQSRRAFTQLDLMLKDGDMDRVRNFGRQLYNTNHQILQQISNQHVKQGFEADPYLNVARVAIMTFGLFKSEEQSVMLLTGIKTVRRLVKLDMSKNNAYANTAAKMEQKLATLMAESKKIDSA